MPVVDPLAVKNLAIAHIRAKSITTENENSKEALECRRFWPHVIGDQLEGPHEWSWGKRREFLALRGTNDREHEWGFAYALPSNLGTPIRVIPDLDSLGIGLPVPLPGEPYAEIWSTQLTTFETPYIIDGDTLYTNIETAQLEFVVNDLAGLNVSQLVITALALDLGSRICVPVKGDSERESKLMTAAEAAWQRAIADDRNRQPEQSGQYISEAMAARRGYLTEAD